MCGLPQINTELGSKSIQDFVRTFDETGGAQTDGDGKLPLRLQSEEVVERCNSADGGRWNLHPLCHLIHVIFRQVPVASLDFVQHGDEIAVRVLILDTFVDEFNNIRI